MATLVINKTYEDGEILGEVNLDNAFNSIADFINGKQIGADNIQNNSIGPAELQTSAVTTAKIADGAVTTGKIADGAVTLQKLASGIVGLLGVAGEIAAFGGTQAPEGWVECDGSALSRSTYSALFDAIGVAFGQGDGSTTFNIPDLRGRFLRGVDSGAGRDPDAASRTAMNTGGNTGNNVGSVQEDAFQDHRHNVVVRDPLTGSVAVAGTLPVLLSTSGVQTAYASTRNGADGTRTSSETRPKNVNVMFIIKT